MDRLSQPELDADRDGALSSARWNWLAVAVCFGAALAFALFRIRVGVGLAFDDLPLVHYLTRTRPALDHSWPSHVITNEVKECSLRRMEAAGRTPQYAVQSLSRFARGYPNVLQDYVEEHYEAEAALQAYVVWRRR